ncbi:uncharacterized protein ACOB8E_005576 isoform 2-T2 [Sarcophilus harrisii]
MQLPLPRMPLPRTLLPRTLLPLLPAAEDPHPANCSIPRRKRRRRKRRRRKRRRRQRHGSPGQRHAAKARQICWRFLDS